MSLPDIRRASVLVSSSGLYGDYHTSSPRYGMWLTSPATLGAFTNAFVTFDLGSNQPVQQMKVWNYNESGTNALRGIQRANISVAGDDMVFTTILTNQVFTKAPGIFTNNIAQLINLGNVQARFVRIDVVTNFGVNEGRVGLSKVRFINTNTPPTIKLVTKNFSGNSVTVQYSETVSPSSATNVANYSIQSGTNVVPILSAAMGALPYNDRVVLQTPTLDSNLLYTVTAQHVFEASGSISITNSTVSIDPEFVLWLRADAGVTADENGLVSQWADQSGAGNTAGETNSSLEPTFVDGALNGKPVLRFDGVNDGLTSPHTPSLIAEGDISFFCVITPQSFANFTGIISKCGTPDYNTNFPATFDFELANTTGKPRLLRGNGSVATTLNGTSNAVLGQTFIVEIVVKGTNAMSYLNGFPNGNAVFADGILDLGNPVRIGRREDNNLYVKGDIAEIMLVRGAVTESERQGIDTYLARKYGILTPFVGPPSIISQPTNLTSYVGSSATFSAVVSTNGATPKAFQWYQTPNVLLTNATNATLVLSNLTLAQDGTSYFLSATNIDGSTNSATATLTVLPVTAPYFTVQPQSQTIFVHQPVTFTASALGSPQLSYQWNFTGAAIIGATNSTLTIANASTNNSGNYTITVTDSLGSTNSDPALLTVVVPPSGSYPAAVLSANPLLYYRFSDIDDTNVTLNYGSLGAGWNGSVQGDYSGDSGPQPPTFPMFENTNLSFGNSTLAQGGVQFPPITLNNTSGGAHCTMTAWVYKEVGQVSSCGIIYTRAIGNSGFGVNLASGADQFNYTWNGGQFTYASGLIVPNFQWCFMAVVVEPTKATLYLQDGTGMKTATNVATHAAVPILSGYVGWDAFNNTRRWFGDIDEPMIFDRALSAAEINALYAGTATTPTSSARLSVSKSGNNLSITWGKGTGTLQRADSIFGPYSDMLGITSPYTFAPDQNGHFYRLRVQ